MNTAHEVSARLATLLRDEQRAMADFLVALADFDARKLWRDLGHASLFAYLRRDLGLSAGAAQYRKTAAELIQAFPAVEAALRSGKLCLSSVVEVAKVLTSSNCAEVLPRFFGLSRREAEAVAVSIRPAPFAPQREIVTFARIASRSPSAAPVPASPAAAIAPSLPEAPTPNATAFRPAETVASSLATGNDRSEPAALEQPDSAKPLSSESARLHVTVSRRFLAKLEAARDALSHAKPDASMEEILEAGLDLLLADRAKKKGLGAKARNAVRATANEPATANQQAAAPTAHVPAQVKRDAWKRAGGRCEFRLHSGEVCGSTTRLEFDHVVPRAQGGPSTIDNIRVLCASHNQLAARRVFGDPWMDRFRRAPPAERAGSVT
jgi:hypothetical protein